MSFTRSRKHSVTRRPAPYLRHAINHSRRQKSAISGSPISGMTFAMKQDKVTDPVQVGLFRSGSCSGGGEGNRVRAQRAVGHDEERRGLRTSWQQFCGSGGTMSGRVSSDAQEMNAAQNLASTGYRHLSHFLTFWLASYSLSAWLSVPNNSTRPFTR